VTFLSGKNKGNRSNRSTETLHSISSMEMQPERAGEVLGLIREYRDIEGGLHQRLDVTAREDSSRVRHRNSTLVLGILRRNTMGHCFQWRSRRQNKRQSTLAGLLRRHERLQQSSRLLLAQIPPPLTPCKNPSYGQAASESRSGSCAAFRVLHSLNVTCWAIFAHSSSVILFFSARSM
jgi:hypothetical protein